MIQIAAGDFRSCVKAEFVARAESRCGVVQDIQRAIDILSSSRRPVMVAGNGVHLSQSHQQLQELAELWDMPVATSYKGKSAIAETHPLSLGMVGIYGQQAANQVVGEVDLHCRIVVEGQLLLAPGQVTGPLLSLGKGAGSGVLGWFVFWVE